jgi:hypothetical protein
MTHVLSRRRTSWTVLFGLACSFVVPRASAAAPDRFPFSIVAATYRDLDGDHDPFPDTGETGRVVFTIRNGKAALTYRVSFILESSDPDVACITQHRVATADLAPGQQITLGSLDAAQPGFTFRVSDALQSLSGADPARIELCLRVQSGEFGSLTEPVCFALPADLDLPPGATPTFLPGPDGVTPSADDGTLVENFDSDRDGDGQFTVNDTFLTSDAGTGRVEHGSYVRGSGGPAGPSAMTGLPCGGFRTPAEGNPNCDLNPDFPMDWHFHCPPGATTCPNIETGACVGGCSYATPQDGRKALTPPNSLHMGAHFTPIDSTGDTTHLRALQAFVSPPLNLTPSPRPGDLTLSMFHIADLVDNHAVVTGNAFVCLDCADVQIQVDHNPDPAADDWGTWDKLAPFQNVYDHVTAAWSTLGFDYCEFTPGDAGTAPPAPRGAHETMCYAQGAWSHCGTVRGTMPASAGDCAGPGFVDPSGQGVWVETRFNLASYLGQRVRIRWIGSTWMFDGRTRSYFDRDCIPELCDLPTDDGWWLDDIRLTGLLASQVSPVTDPRSAPPTACPVPCADADKDAWSVCDGDCDDADPATHPYALEINDGRDNQCPGYIGSGVTDEISGRTRFSIPSNPDFFVWPQQIGATSYLVARSSRADFSAACVTFQTSSNNLTDPVRPAAGGAFFYLVRPQAPHVGSWGQDSSGREITGICGL